MEDYFFPNGFDFVDYLILTFIELRSFMQIFCGAAHQTDSKEEIMPDYICYRWQNIIFHFCCKFTLVHCLIIFYARQRLKYGHVTRIFQA